MIGALCLGQDRRGTVAVEFAIVFPVLLLFLLGMVVYGQVIWTTQALQSTAQQTARCVAIGSNACPTPSSYAVTKAAAYGVNGLTASGVAVVTSQTVCSAPGTSTFVQVTLTVPFTNPVGTLLPSFPTSIVAVACYPATVT